MYMIGLKEESVISPNVFGLKVIIVIMSLIGISMPLSVMAQDPLQQGFDLLATNQYASAEVYFEEYFGVYDKTARICHARAVGLGGRPLEALSYLLELDEAYPDDTEIELNVAEAYLWNKEANKAIQAYASILTNEPDNFVANLGYAHAHASIQKNEIALEYIHKALALKGTDATALNSKNHISLAHAFQLYKQGSYSQSTELLDDISDWEDGAQKVQDLYQQVEEAGKKHVFGEYSYAYDGDDNQSKQYLVGVDIPLADRHRLSLRGAVQESYRVETDIAKIQRLGIAYRFIMSDKIYLHLGVDYLTTRSNEVQSNIFLGNAAVEFFPSQRFYAKLSYESRLHDYGINLINRQVQGRNLSGAFNILITPRLGLYSNGILTTQSDGNIRRLSYNSLYYMLTDNPVVKVGISHNYISFLERNIFYFSPESYHLLEGFMRIDNDNNGSAIKYAFQTSFGSERINGSEPRATTRIEALLGYNFKSGLGIQGSYLASTAAANNILGIFSYNETKLRLSYKF